MDFRTWGRTLSTVRTLREHSTWSHAQVSEHQAQALAALRQHAYQHSTFYREFHKGKTDAPLRDLPVLTKTRLMENFDKLVTDRNVTRAKVEQHVRSELKTAQEKLLDRYWVSATSGTTGQPAYFLYNQDEWATVLANVMRMQESVTGRTSLLRPPRTAFVTTNSPYHMSTRIRVSLRMPIIPVKHFTADLPIAQIVEGLNEWQPQNLTTYASMLRLLAREQRDGRLKIQPKYLFSTSEVLTDETRRLAEEAFGIGVYNQYVTTETGPLAFESAARCGLHIMDDLTIVEVVDDNYQPVAPGVFGSKVLLTVLFNQTQPLIRYELSDSIQLSTALCDQFPGFGVIEKIQGRVEDVLYFPSIAGKDIPIHPIAIHRVLDVHPSTGWQLIQERDTLTVMLAGAEGGDDRQLVTLLQNMLSSHGVVMPAINVWHTDVIPRSETGKTPLIKVVR